MKLAVLVTILACAACTQPDPVAAPPAPPEPSPSTAAPSVAAVPHAALLTPEDFGAGYSVKEQATTVPPPSEPAYLLPVMDCPDAGGPSRESVTAGLSQLYAAPRGHFDSLTVWRYRGDGAAHAMTELREQLRRCARSESVGDENTTVVRTWTLLATDFAGPGSVALRNELRRDGVVSDVDFHVIVPHGDMVASLWLSDQRWTTARLRAIGQRLAARLGG
jgi:hypothetical protein